MSCSNEEPRREAAQGEPRRANRNGQIPKDKVGFDVARPGKAAASVARGSQSKNRLRPLRAAADAEHEARERTARKAIVSSS